MVRFVNQRPRVKEGLALDLKALEGVHKAAMTDLVTGFVGELREQVEGAGLGRRLANTWRGTVYPKSGDSLHPAGWVESKAPKIIAAFAHGATILPLNGKRYLWIPTDKTPLRGRGRKMTPREVIATFAQPFVFIRSREGRLLACVKVLKAKSGRGFRRATTRRLAQGREVELVAMFTLMPAVRLDQRINPDAAFDRWAGRFDALTQARWDGSPLGRSR
jgi:hypothetical protein